MKHLLSIIIITLFLFSCSKETPVPSYFLVVNSGNGGSVNTNGGTYKQGTIIQLTATPDPEFTFTGWSNGSIENPISITLNGNITLNATFSKKKYDIKINIVGEGRVTEEIISSGKEYNSGTVLRLNAIPDENWDFMGWSGSISDTQKLIDISILEKKEITATFETFNVTAYEPISIQKNYNVPLFVHYMPWFESPEFSEFTVFGSEWGGHWTMSNNDPEVILENGRRDIASYFYPMIGPYDNGEPDYCEYAAAIMKISGIDGVVFDTPFNSPAFDHKLQLDHTSALIPWLKKAGLKYMVCFEDNSLFYGKELGYFDDMVERGKEVMLFAQENFFSDADYFKIDNKPVLLDFGPQSIKTDAEWNEVFSVIPPIHYLTLAYHGDYFGINTASDGSYAWVGECLNNEYYDFAKKFKTVGGGAMFGYKEYNLLGGWSPSSTDPIDPRGGDLFRESLQRAKNANIDFLQIVTWNAWGEGTQIEPSLDFGFQPLTILEDFVGITPNEEDLQLAVDLYNKRKENKGKLIANQKLDQVFYYLISGQYFQARDLLSEL